MLRQQSTGSLLVRADSPKKAKRHTSRRRRLMRLVQIERHHAAEHTGSV